MTEIRKFFFLLTAILLGGGALCLSFSQGADAWAQESLGEIQAQEQSRGSGNSQGQAQSGSPKETPLEDATAEVDPLENFNSYTFCGAAYAKDQTCPKNICELKCVKQLANRACLMECVPRQCVTMSAEDCPQDICKVLEGCNQKKICYPKEKRDPPECGGMAYAGDDVECCDGFVRRCGVEFFDGSCDMEGTGSLDSVPICIPCGNGICNQFENRCNCPEDCSNDTSMIELLKSIKSKINVSGSQ